MTSGGSEGERRRDAGRMAGDDVAMLRSAGFLVGVSLLVVGFIVGMMSLGGLVPEGLPAEAAAGYLQLAVAAPAAFVYAIAGILAPPSPFFAGAILGFVNATIVSILAVLALDAAVSLDRLAPVFVGSIVMGTALTGGIGWTLRRIRGERAARSSATDEL